MTPIKKQFEQERDDKSQTNNDAYLSVAFKAMDDAGIHYNDEMLGHVADDNYRAGFNEGALDSSVTKMLEDALVSWANYASHCHEYGPPPITFDQCEHDTLAALANLAELRKA